jgi:hypothetical protein
MYGAGTIIEVNVSELGLVTPAGKVVWGKYAQVRYSCVSSRVWLARKPAGHVAGCTLCVLGQSMCLVAAQLLA